MINVILKYVTYKFMPRKILSVARMEISMRVIAGTCRSLPLVTPEGEETRPTTDRIKETLFNMLQPYLCDCHFLDLFSGSGAIGIEALSRGAEQAVFVEMGQEPLRCIRNNLKNTKLEGQAKLLAMDVMTALQQLDQQGEPFDIIFMDPPYRMEWERKVLEFLLQSKIVDEDTLIIFEASLDTDLSYISDMGYTIHKIKKYKTNMHVFLYKNV